MFPFWHHSSSAECQCCCWLHCVYVLCIVVGFWVATSHEFLATNQPIKLSLNWLLQVKSLPNLRLLALCNVTNFNIFIFWSLANVIHMASHPHPVAKGTYLTRGGVGRLSESVINGKFVTKIFLSVNAEWSYKILWNVL